MERLRPELSIAVVLYNSAGELGACLPAVSALIDRGWAELVAVDNGSPDESAEIVTDLVPSARVLRLPENRGFAGGANAALAEATGRYWLLLNPDVRIPDGALEQLVRWMDEHPRIAAASPDIYAADGHWESPGRAAPSVARSVLETLRLHRLLSPRLRGRVLRGPYWTGGDQLDAGWVPGTAMVIRPEAAREVGLLRDDFFMYGEDIEWCWRMRRRGWRIGVCSSVRFLHENSASARRTWNDAETERRIAAGAHSAYEAMYGRRHANLLAGVNGLAFWLESRAPGRDNSHRGRARDEARIWLGLAKSR